MGTSLTPRPLLLAVLLLLAGLAAASGAAATAPTAPTPRAPDRSATGPGPRIAVTGPPLAAILGEIAGPRAAIVSLVPAGASPHTYEPRPSDLATASSGAALFFVAPHFDGWAARLPAKERIEVLALLPAGRLLPNLEHPAGAAGPDGHDHLDVPGAAGVTGDPHFWTDPALVRFVVPGLVAALSRIDPAGSATYRENGRAFEESLGRLDAELAATLAPVRGRALVLLHASFQYLCARYGLDLAGIVEPIPGKEPTPRDLKKLVRTMKTRGVRAVFAEPQLPRRPAEVLAEAAGVTVAEIDPMGGAEGRRTYAELMRFNARVLAEALK